MITGKIEKKEISEGASEKGPWTRCAFTIDGKKYSSFDKKIIEGFKVGDVVSMEGEQRGEYWNMRTMVPALEARVANAEGVPKSNETNDLLRQILAELKEMNFKK